MRTGRLVTAFAISFLVTSWVAGTVPVFGAPAITEYPVPSDGVGGAGLTSEIAAGPDGAIWFVEWTKNDLGRLDPSGIVSEIPLPADFLGTPFGITTGPDGNLWFTEEGGGVGRLVLPDTFTEFRTGFFGVDSITVGPDGNLWFTGLDASNVWRITTSGVITAFPFAGFYQRASITRGPDGNIWFDESGGFQRIWRMTPAGVATSFQMTGDPRGITTGPDGNLWYADFSGNDIERITPSGVITVFHLERGLAPFDITGGSDGNLWFTEEGNFFNVPSAIGRITPAGEISLLKTPTSNSAPDGITATGKSIWFVEGVGNIGRVSSLP